MGYLHRAGTSENNFPFPVYCCLTVKALFVPYKLFAPFFFFLFSNHTFGVFPSTPARRINCTFVTTLQGKFLCSAQAKNCKWTWTPSAALVHVPCRHSRAAPAPAPTGSPRPALCKLSLSHRILSLSSYHTCCAGHRAALGLQLPTAALHATALASLQNTIYVYIL